MATTKAYVFMGLKLENVYLVWGGGGGGGGELTFGGEGRNILSGESTGEGGFFQVEWKMNKFLVSEGTLPHHPSRENPEVSKFDGWNDLISAKFNPIKVTILKFN